MFAVVTDWNTPVGTPQNNSLSLSQLLGELPMQLWREDHDDIHSQSLNLSMYSSRHGVVTGSARGEAPRLGGVAAARRIKETKVYYFYFQAFVLFLND